MLKARRVIIASLVSPLAILIVPILGSIIIINSDPITPMAPGDDAPIKSAAFFLFGVIPVAYPALIITVFLSAGLLERLNLLSKRSLSILVLLSSILLSALIGFQSPYGIGDQLIGTGILFSLFVFCFGLGAIVWWLIAKPEQNLKSSDD